MIPRLHIRRERPSPRGFTLVELMVAVTGGLIVAVIVFGLAREGTRIYRQESKVADATLGAVVGFNRLSNDLAHAGFLSTPNILAEPRLCGTVDATWPAELRRLASVRITPSTATNALLTANGRAPDDLVISGSLTHPVEFSFLGVTRDGANSHVVTLILDSRSALAQFGYVQADESTRTDILEELFPVGRGLRIASDDGKYQFATIEKTGVYGGSPAVWVKGNLVLQGTGETSCSLNQSTPGAVSVINIVRYRIADLQGGSGFVPEDRALYSRLFDDGGTELSAWDQNRTELVREELDTAGSPIDGTLEVVAEYAVDLEFGVTAITGNNGREPTILTSSGFNPTLRGSMIPQYAGDVSAGGVMPERLRGIRARLSVRSRVPDREGDITAGGAIAPGFYRMGLGTGATAPFARVRTLQAEIPLRNQEATPW